MKLSKGAIVLDLDDGIKGELIADAEITFRGNAARDRIAELLIINKRHELIEQLSYEEGGINYTFHPVTGEKTSGTDDSILPEPNSLATDEGLRAELSKTTVRVLKEIAHTLEIIIPAQANRKDEIIGVLMAETEKRNALVAETEKLRES